MKNSKNSLLKDKARLAEYIKMEYDNGKSFTQIAEELGTYTNYILRAVRKFGGIKVRDKGETQARVLKSGRHAHPTKGKHRSEKVKQKIGDSVSQAWDNAPQDEKDRRSKISKEIWDAKPEWEKQELIRKSGEAIRAASQHGSILERFLATQLIKAGYRVECHKEHFIINENLQIDLYLPNDGIAIEVDGPSHFRSVWGEDKLRQTQQSDQHKTGLLLARGLNVIRIKQEKYLSESYKRKVLKALLELIESLPNTKEKYHELEV